ncbi:MAG: YfhO family protein, partial [Melioribacteraceae bacterium]
NKFIPEKYQTAAAFGIILIIFLIYFSPLYSGGKTFESGDIITAHSSTTYIDKERDGYTLWNPYIFCGMPAYVIAVDYKWFNMIYVGITSLRTAFSSLFEVEYAMWSFYLLMLAFSSFLLTKHLTKNTLLGLFGGLATSFSTGIILFLFIGHVTKLTALAFYPLIFLMLLRFEEKIKLRDFAILIIVLTLSILGWHVQIIFYTLFAVMIYYLYFIIESLIKKSNENLIKYIKSGLTFAAAFIIAVLMMSDNLTQVYEYNPYSTRGTQSVTDKDKGSDPNKQGSEFYDYATNWSFSPGEVLTFIVPSYYGFGNSKYSGPLTQGAEVEVNTYFGQMPFTDVAMYMGVVIFFLGLFSIYLNWENRFIRYLTVLIIISLLISFGRTFPLVYDFMFYYFPFFDKFRVPSMILVLLQLTFPILAAMGIYKIILLKKNNDLKAANLIKYSAILFSAIFLLSVLLNGVISDWFAGRINDHVNSLRAGNQQLAQQFSALSEYITEMFTTDLTIAFALLSISFWLIYSYWNLKISSQLMIAGLVVVTLFDLMRIDSRGAKYNEAQNADNLFIQPDYITVIKNQKDKDPYRIFNMKRDGSLGSVNRNSNFNSYFLQHDFYGYSAVKPRSYQDFMDVLGPVNINLWRMLNVKYIVADQQIEIQGLSLISAKEKSFVYRNENALPRAYFVDSIATAESEMQIVKNIESYNYDPKKVMYTLENLNVEKPDSTAFADIIKYEDEKIEMEVNASGNNLLFLGDTYYPNGWFAYVDGNETEIHKINHGFRGIIVPAGKHKVEFVYSPVSFAATKYIVLILSVLTVLLLVFSLLKENKILFKTSVNEPAK